MPRATDTLALLRVLHRHRVKHIVVGMTAAVLQGAPAVTLDLDVVYALDPENVDRLLDALTELDATFRHDDRRISPNRSHLESAGHKLLTTVFGDLDLLGTIDDGAGHDALLPDSLELGLADRPVRVLRLRRLIEIKERAGRPKDLAVLPLLRSTLERSTRR
jgi:hypothetical protein